MSGTRLTKQRDAIIKSISSAEGPLSVSETHKRARRELPELGIATVYRTLKTLRENGEVSVVALPGEAPRYEPAGRGHLHHFRCRSCERIFGLDAFPIGLPEGAVLTGGHEVEAHSLTLYGRCSSCLSP